MRHQNQTAYRPQGKGFAYCCAAKTAAMLLLALAPACRGLFAQSSVIRAPTPREPDRVEIPHTRVQGIHSSIARQEYTLHINLPANYEQSGAAYPVLYLLDGQWDFPLVSAIYGEQYFDGFIPGLITVGVTWGGDNPNYDQLRARDFTPSSPDGSDRWGHAAKFLAFIKQELIPFIDSAYRTEKNERTLMGSSLGGLFTLYALFNETELFNHYILTSPAFQWDNGNLFNYEKEYAENRSAIPVRVFIGIGALEPSVPAFQGELVNHFKAEKYKGLEIETRVMENTGHSGSKAEGYARGLQSVFARPSLKIASDELDQYTGVYVNGSDTLNISRDKEHLIWVRNNDIRSVLDAESPTDFYFKGAFFNLHVKKDEKGEVEGVQRDVYSGQKYLKKIIP